MTNSNNTTLRTSKLPRNEGACERFTASTEAQRIAAMRGTGAYYQRRGYSRDEAVEAVIRTIPVAKTPSWEYLEAVSRGWMAELAIEVAEAA